MAFIWIDALEHRFEICVSYFKLLSKVTVGSGADQKNIKFPRHWPLWGNSLVNSPHKRPVTRKIFPFDDVIMSWVLSVCREYREVESSVAWRRSLLSSRTSSARVPWATLPSTLISMSSMDSQQPILAWCTGIRLRTRSEFGPRFNIKLSSHRWEKSHYGDKTVLRSSNIYNKNSYTGKMACCLYW